jgi:hypothetical protein
MIPAQYSQAAKRLAVKNGRPTALPNIFIAACRCCASTPGRGAYLMRVGLTVNVRADYDATAVVVERL